MQKAKIIKAYKGNDYYCVTVKCPYCEKEHRHGLGPRDNPREPGDKVAHCDGSKSYQLYF